MIRRYGSANGFGWQKNEIIGAQIVSVPEALPVRMADQAFRSFVWSVGAVFLACLVLLDIALLFMVVRPLVRLSAMADQISLGKFDVPEIPVRGNDEIATLSASFTRMRRSLERAMKLLE
jgi:HAMP domain-containing protein